MSHTQKGNRMFFSCESASAELKIMRGNLGFLTSVFSHDRGLGHGRLIMTEITEWADLSKMTLELIALGYAAGKLKPNLSEEELVWFYEKFGFYRVPHYLPRMRRDFVESL